MNCLRDESERRVSMSSSFFSSPSSQTQKKNSRSSSSDRVVRDVDLSAFVLDIDERLGLPRTSASSNVGVRFVVRLVRGRGVGASSSDGIFGSVFGSFLQRVKEELVNVAQKEKKEKEKKTRDGPFPFRWQLIGRY